MRKLYTRASTTSLNNDDSLLPNVLPKEPANKAVQNQNNETKFQEVPGSDSPAAGDSPLTNIDVPQDHDFSKAPLEWRQHDQAAAEGNNEEQQKKPEPSLAQFSPACDVSAKDVASAIKRAKTVQCKQEIADVFCQQQNGTLYTINLPNYCPNKGQDAGHYYGCYRDSSSSRDLDGGMTELSDNTPQACIDHCYRSAQKYAGLQYGKECWCGSSYGKHSDKLDEAHCFTKCPGDASQTCGAYLANKVYGTGVQEVIRQDAPLEYAPVEPDIPRVKIVFVLTVNGRAVRQVNRLLRLIYSPSHYYYIHVDKRQEYLFRELRPLEDRFTNVHLTRQRFSTIWGGASLLQAHLSFLTELFEDKKNWTWDYYINLSESDYPVKPVSDLVEYLTAYKGFNFLRSFGKNVPRFIKKQGIDQTFHECEDHLWRVAPRPLPSGVIFDGGSDWIGLFREFARYALNSKDKLVTGLKQYYKYSLLPVESFFHMVLQNSLFCSQSVDNNLHLTNWRRKQGCKCQYKHIVDWCGCSPNNIKISDMERLLHYDKKPMFFARKFEAIVDQEVINSVDVTFHGYLYSGVQSLSNYWQNVYHHLDKNTKVKDAALTIYSSIERIASSLLDKTMTSCALKPFKLLETTVFNEADHFHGLLVLFSAQLQSTGQVVTLEVHAEPQHYYSVVDNKGKAARLQSLEVGTDFDVKELIFRNDGNLIGPFDEITLRHAWLPGTEFSVSIAWVDPTNEIAASYDVHIPSVYHVGNQKPFLNKPLRPGMWKSCVMIDLKLVACTQFLVTPLTFYNNRPISSSEARRAHQGPNGLYTSTDFSEFKPNLNLNDDPKLISEANINSRKTGPELAQWVDMLAKFFWVVQNTCVTEFVSACPMLVPCQNVSWSSRSPDLKSDTRYIGAKIPVVS
uniref:protein xylosyltransferase n=1 Tax=Biomphalaria glabrata TaxID=6526 RepID=A0A2C9MAE7_BIOGL